MYTQLHGQFGNQLYEIAASQYIANNNNYNLYLVENDKYKYDFNNVFEKKFNFIDKASIENKYKNIHYKKINSLFNEYINFSNESNNTRYYHPFQNQKYWNYDKDFCIDLFKFNKEKENEIINKYDISEIEDSIIIHIRRAYHFNDNYIFDTKWFNKIIKKNNIIIFSDDCNYIKRIIKTNYTNYLSKNIKIIKNNLYDDFYLMTKAKNICIGASTFSWWASYLNKENNIYITNYTNEYMESRLKNNEGYFFHNNIKVVY